MPKKSTLRTEMPAGAVPVDVTGDGAPAPAPTPAPAAPLSMDWNVNERKELLFSQVIGVGPKAFISNRANIKPDKDGKGGALYDKKLVWETEIIGKLKTVENFKDARWPADHQGALNFVERVVKANDHLYKQGKEQAEPAAAGTEGTKDERFSPWQQAIIDVYELMQEAEAITKENQKKKAGEASVLLEEEKEMQDAAAQSAYDKDGKRRRRRGGKSPAGAMDLDGDDDDDDAAPASAKKPKKEPITVQDYATATNKDVEKLLEDCATGKTPAGYTYVDPEATDFTGEPVFLEPYLVPVSSSSTPSSSGAKATRENVNEFLKQAGKARENQVALEKTKETNRANERDRELTLEERKLKMQERQMKQMLQMQKALMAKAGMTLDSDSDDEKDK